MNVSPELIIQRHRNGIKLARPVINDHHGQENAMLSLGNLLKNQFYVYLMNCDGAIRLGNESLAEMYQTESPVQLVGKTIYDFCKTKAADIVRSNDMDVLNKQKIKIINEKVIPRLELRITNVISIKYPCYDEKNFLTGIFGLSIPLKTVAIGESLEYMMQLGLLNNTTLGLASPAKNNYDNRQWSQLSARQKEIVQRIVRGCTNKEIASNLNLSIRTVEHYIEIIKNKLDVYSKFDIIKKYHQCIVIE